MKTKRFLSLFIAVVLCLSSFTAFAEDGLTDEIVMEYSPYDEYVDYSNMYFWSRWNNGEDKPADLFFVCPTVDMGKGGNFNSYITDEKYRESFDGAVNMELGIYDDVARIYAPYYRQATFPVYSLSKEEQEKYLSIAYEDVKKAFLYFADHTDATRPLILAGFSQGADMIIRLMKDLFDEPKYQRRLVSAYAIGWKLTEDEVKEYPHLMPAVGETDTGSIIAFNSEDKDITSSLIIGEDEKTYSINPLNWKTTSEIADKSLNKGACFTDYSGNIKEEIPNLTGAYIDEKRGALKVLDIAKEDYPGKLFDDGIYHLYDYQFFFRNLEENVDKRLSAFNEKYKDKLDVIYNNDLLTFDVEPIIENGRTLVPFRTIFETMGCAVYYSEEDNKQIVSARRANDSYLIFSLVVKFVRKNHLSKVLVVFCLILFASVEVIFPQARQLPFGLGRGAIGAAFMLFGFWIKEYKLLENKSKRYYILTNILALVLFIGALHFGSDGSAFVRSIYGPHGVLSVFATFIGGVAGVWFLLSLCMIIEKLPTKWLKKLMSYTGRNVMTVYAWHMAVKFLFDAIYICLIKSSDLSMLDEYKMGLMPQTSMPFMLFEAIMVIFICLLFPKIRKKINRNWRMNL